MSVERRCKLALREWIIAYYDGALRCFERVC